MGINTELNIAPYHDDYDETKQYVRVLFKPARAVQARELTQLQSILQNQIERFGNNVYQNGTIIEGVNPTVDKKVSFVKINDQSAITDLTIYASTDEVSYYLTGQTSKLRAKIVAGANGFQTDAPNLKTFFIKYLLSSLSSETGVEYKEFVGGELLSITREQDGVETSVTSVTAATSTATDGTVDNVGQSLAVNVTSGIIYQNGHFNFVAEQLIIASKYTPNPDNISIGFTIEESIVDSALDVSLLDNAQGFNNQNAPGADRLKLEPKLAVYTTTTRPKDFFALLRIEKGETVFVRGETEFNSVKQELAKRTNHESGNYVVKGFKVTTEKDEDTGKFFAAVGPGTAYAFGYEVSTVGTQKLEITPPTTTNKKIGQATGVEYGAWLTVDVSASGTDFEPFDFKTRYNLYATNYDANDVSTQTPIGSCSIRNIEPVGANKVRIYVYGITKDTDDSGNNAFNRYDNIGYIGSASAPIKTEIIATSEISNITFANQSTMLFRTGREGMKSIENTVFTQRELRTYANEIDTDDNGGEVQIDQIVSGDVTKTPIVESSLSSGGIFGITTANEYVEATGASVQSGTNSIQVNFPAGKLLRHIYYNATVSGTTHDTLEDISVWLSSTFNKVANYGNLGLPNCIRLNKVEYEETAGNWVDITSKFSLVTNAKDGYYGISYIKLRQGQSLDSDVTPIRVNAIALKRIVNGGYLTANSYSGVTNAADIVKPFEARNGVTYNTLNCYDFRPYADSSTQYFTEAGNSAPVTTQSLQFDPDRAVPSISNNSVVTGDQEYFLGRIDTLAIDAAQSFVIVKGQPSDNPIRNYSDTTFGIADIYVPANDLTTSNANALKVKRNTTRNFTMQDIERLDRRVSISNEILAMSILEQSTQNRFIPDANGNNRFKNGILVDQFKNFDVADVTNGDFRSSIHPGRAILAPAIKQMPIDLKVDGSSNVTTFDNVTTLSSVERETLLFQENATNFRNLASNFWNFRGNMQIAPQFDSSFDVTQNPDANIEIDLYGFAEDLLVNMNEMYPTTLDTTTSVLTSTRKERIGNTRKGWQFDTYQDTTHRQELVVNDNLVQADLGNFVTDFSLKPYMTPKSIKIYVAGLRPNTRHYIYFDGLPVNNHTSPGAVYESDIIQENGGRSIKADDVYASAPKGSAIYTDEFGKFFAVFDLPGESFYVGDRAITLSDSPQFDSIESAGTSFARETYHAYNFAISKTQVGTSIREADFDVEESIFITDRTIKTKVHMDPLAQTFQVDPVVGEGSSYIFTDKIDLWFRKKSSPNTKNGITVQIRETANPGYFPSDVVLPMAVKHIDWDLINVSSDAAEASKTEVVFDDPIRLEVGKHYAIVIIPDGTDPDYFIFTSVSGGTDINDDSVTVGTDWGMGMLFTSTNNRAWKDYQSEDIKFRIYKKVFSEETGYLDLVPNDMEFFNLTHTFGEFIDDEYAYVQAAPGSDDSQFQGTLLNNRKVQVANLSSQDNTNFTSFITAGSTVIVTQGAANTHVSVVDSISTSLDGSTHTVKLREAPPLPFAAGQTCSLIRAIGGKVVNFDRTDPTRLAIKESTSGIGGALYDTSSGNQIITGAKSGAAARIASIFNSPISYIQPFLMEQNTLRTTTSLQLFKHSSAHEESLGVATTAEDISFANSTYLSNEQRFIPSRQNVLVDGNSNTVDKLRFRVTLDNTGFDKVTPVIDNALASVHTYNYFISDDNQNTSQYVSAPVVLQPGHPAEGLTVFLAAFRPKGSMVEVQARFLLPSDPDNYTDWVSLENKNPAMFSSAANLEDYREFEYTFDEQAFITGVGSPNSSDFDGFQIKIILKHETASTGSNVFPHVYDYRAIALT